MKVSVCTNYAIYRSNLNYGSNQKTPAAKAPENLKKEKVIKASAYGLGALALVGTGVYIWKHKSLPKNSSVNEDTVSLISTPLPDEALANSLPDFLKQKLSVNHNYDKFKKLIASPDKNLEIGSGANSKVYDIPFMPEYVLKMLNPNKNVEPNKIPPGVFPDNINLGQAVWVHPDNFRVILLKKVTGKPHSVKDWSDIIYNKQTKAPVPVTKAQAHDYYTNIIKISLMPQSTFDDLAMQVKVLDTTPKVKGETQNIGFKTDCINPNNLLVDFKNNKLNFIDYFAKDKPDHRNSYMDMVAVISDFTLMPEFYDLMKPNQQKRFLKALKTIDEKCFKGAQKVDLTTDKNVFSTFINETNKYFPIQSVKKPDGKGEYIRQYEKTAQHLLDLLAGLK